MADVQNNIANADDNNAAPVPAAGGENNNLYEGAKMSGKCGCELCRSGVATTHNDESHDQSLNQNFQLDGDSPLKLDIVGGTTKCGRVMSNYFASLQESIFKEARGIEVGAGTGIVGMTLAHLGAKMIMTDMDVVLETVEYNVGRAPKNVQDNVKIKGLLWGDEAYKHQPKESEQANFDYVFGSDLIYAHETIADLVRTFEILSAKPLDDGSFPPVYIAVIRRFNWEQEFFDGMAVSFQQKIMLEFQDITIYRYERIKPFVDGRDVEEEVEAAENGDIAENAKLANEQRENADLANENLDP